MEFPAVAEDFSLADDAGGSPSVIRVSEPLRAVVGTVPRMDVGNASFLPGWNSRLLPRISPWPMMLGDLPQSSVLVNRCGLLSGRFPGWMLGRHPFCRDGIPGRCRGFLLGR